MSWCNKRGIKIYFEPIDWNKGNLIIDDNGKKQTSEEIYKQKKLNKKDIDYHKVILNLYYAIRKKIEETI